MENIRFLNSYRNIPHFLLMKCQDGYEIPDLWNSFKTGLIVAGLNDAAHSLQVKYLVDTELEEIGINGSDKPAPSLESVDKVKQAKTLVDMYNKSTKPTFEIMDSEVGPSKQSGEFLRLGNKIQLYKSAFKSYRILAIRLNHELYHSISWVGPKYRLLGMVEKIGKNAAFCQDEINAYNEGLRYGGPDPEASFWIKYYQWRKFN